MEQPALHASVALVVGVTGMAGLSLAEALKSPTAPGGPWAVYGASRGPPPATWFPPSALDRHIQFDALDSAATGRALSPLSPHVTHVFWVALAAHDTEVANIAANSAMLANVLRALTADPTSALRHVTLQTGTKHYMGPFLDPANVGRIAPVELPFREDTPRLPEPLFYYALEDLVASYSDRLSWSVHRSSTIIGASPKSVYNMLLTLAAYASICRRQGSPFRFPGSGFAWEHFCDATDAGLLADQHIWAAVAAPAAAKNQAFNCTNGDVFTWRSFWRVLSEEFDVGFVPFEPADAVGSDWAARMKEKGAVWDAIVEEEGLCRTRLEEITCFDAAHAVLSFGFQHVCCVNKSREFGFRGSVDTLKSVRRSVARLREMNIIPTVRSQKLISG